MNIMQWDSPTAYLAGVRSDARGIVEEYEKEWAQGIDQ